MRNQNAVESPDFKPARILLVDDDAGVLSTLEAVLAYAGHSVRAANTVPEALREIVTNQFDVLITDLNLGRPGDGFSVASAMRRLQPKCAAFLITGFPDFLTALQYIASQVDQYLLKPVDPAMLCRLIDSRGQRPLSGKFPLRGSVSSVLLAHENEIKTRALAHLKQAPPRWSEAEYASYLQPLLTCIAAQLESPQPGAIPDELVHTAANYGILCRAQGYTPAMLVEATAAVSQAVYEVVESQMAALDLSLLLRCLMRFNFVLLEHLKHSIAAHGGAPQQAAD